MPEQEITGVLDAYAAAVLAKDADALLGLYADDVRVFDLWGQWAYDGATAWRRPVEEWFGSLGDERIVVRFDEVRSTVGADLAVAHAFITYAAVGPDGAELRAMTNRLTWCLQRTAGGGWTIVHEHTSAPADGETGAVQLTR